jgi:hypothetical protein
MVTAGIDGVPVQWRIRQQKEEFCHLLQKFEFEDDAIVDLTWSKLTR